MNDGQDDQASRRLDAAASDALTEALEALAAHEKAITERLYPLFFERRPDSQPLFGVYALAEREEMVRETLRSLLALAEDEPWLKANLEALGRSHFEYGVTSDMYGDFVDAFVDVAPACLDAKMRDALRRGLERITDTMRRAGDRA
jgi:hemoglobin-like flavoprotein